MKIEILPDANGIEEEWWELWKRDSAATPFQSPAWLMPWRRQFPAGKSVVLTVREGARLVALLPLFAYEGRLLPWGAGTSDWLDGVFDPDLDLALLPHAIAKLGLPVELFQLRADTPLIRMRSPEGWSERVGTAESCVVLPLPARRPGSRMAQKLRYYRRRAARAGIGEAQHGCACDIEALADLHTRRWSREGRGGVFADPRMLAWQREALPLLEAAGLLRLYVLKSAVQTVAALCVLAAKSRSFYFIGGFDPQHAALGVGTVLVGHAIGEAEREGHSSFDFLRGGEAYKYRWGARDQPTRARYLIPPERQCGT